MIDPLLSLAMSIHANPGVYALLLGSGISRSAGIPTGWEVVENVIRRIAVLEKENCEPDPAAWYAKKYGRAPAYSDLLDAVAKSPAERSQLLRGYFEPTAEEREQHVKVPTAAHGAIAQLMQQGYVRIVITTNFDRLMEQALEARGVTPTVISTPDSVEGALPLMHSRHTLIKVHGDYLDTRIKNTPEELATFDGRTNALLDRVCDECGLIVCGWSAEWDAALRAALERRKARRFSTYWATRSEPTGEAKRLIGLLKAETVKIKGADEFFPQLAEKVEALQGIERSHLLSAKVAVAQAKKYLQEDRYRIQLHDLLVDEVERIVRETGPEHYPVSGSFKNEDVVKRIGEFEAISAVAVAIVCTGCCWGGKDHRTLWTKAINRLANPSRPQACNKWMQGLSGYPALLLLYGGGIAAVSADHYDTLYELFSRPKVLGHRCADDLAMGLHDQVAHDVFKVVPGLERKRLPRCERLFTVLREPLRDILRDGTSYERAFDRFEAFLSFWTADVAGWAMPGAFMYRHVAFREGSVLSEIIKEHEVSGDNWRPFKVGFFGGKPDRWEPALELVMEMTGSVGT